MLNGMDFLKTATNPRLIAVALRRLFPWRAARHDQECRHLISAWSSGRLPRLPLAALFPGIANTDVLLRKAESRAVGWSLDLQELVHLLSIVKFTRPKVILEIGTFDGFTALNLAANVETDAEVRTLDLPQNLDSAEIKAKGISNAWINDRRGEKFLSEPEAIRIRQLWGDSLKADWNTFGPPFDLILIDGAHEYPYVRSDSLNALQSIRPGGTILWHDYGQCLGVSRAVDELAVDKPIRAIKGTRFACLRVPTSHPGH